MQRLPTVCSPFFCLLLASAGGCASGPPLEVVDHVDLNRYAGKWYEIARYPHSFERGCHDVTAEYSLREDGRLDVVNTCRVDSFDGPLREATAVGRVVDPETNAKLKVCFFWPFEGDYWIIELAEDYTHAVVGDPRRDYLWILARDPRLDEQDFVAITGRLAEKGYDAAKLIRTPQSAD